MTKNRLPLYLVFVLVGLAIIYGITNPRPPLPPGPIGGLPNWKSTVALGMMVAHSTNPSGTMWAGAWTEKPNTGPARSTVWIIDFSGYAAKPCILPEGTDVHYLSWADDNTIRACCSRAGSNAKGPEIVFIDAAAGKVKSSTSCGANIVRPVYWPNGSPVFVAETVGKPDQMLLAVFGGGGAPNSKACEMIGKPAPAGGPPDVSLFTDAGVAADGSSFVFSLTEPAAKDGRSYWLANTRTGTAKKMFELGAVPGRIEGIWPSAAGVLMVCKVNHKFEDVLLDPATGKLIERLKGVGDPGKWPGAPKSIAYSTANGGFDFDLATGKNKTLFDLSKRDSYADKHLRDLISDSRLYKLKSGNYIAVSETSGAIDIRELKPDGSRYRDLLPRQ